MMIVKRLCPDCECDAVMFKNVLPWLIWIGIITLAVFYFGLDEITLVLGEAEWSTMLLLTGLQVGTLSITAYQWQFLINKSSGNITLGRLLAINLAGNYVESVTPSVKVGGESAKIFLLHKHTALPYQQLAGIMLALKYFSLLPFLGLISVALGTAFFIYELPRIILPVFLVFLLFFLLIAWFHLKSGKDKSGVQREENKGTGQPGETAEAGYEYRDLASGKRLKAFFKKKALSLSNFVQRASFYSRGLVSTEESVLLVVFSGLIWVLYPLKVYLVARMIGLEAGLVTVTIATFTAYLVSMVPLLPGGLGSFEGTMALMFTVSGLPPAEGLTVALLTRLITFWFPLLLSSISAGYLALNHNHYTQLKRTNVTDFYHGTTLGQNSGRNAKKDSPFFSLSQKMESIAARSAFVAFLYHKIFYKKMLEKEFYLAELKPGSTVLHIGSGAYPYTAFYLADKGFKVEALDCNEKAVVEAENLIKKMSYDDKINTLYGNGVNLKGKSYDAIWVSLNISPKEKVLQNAYFLLKDSGVLVYRNLPPWVGKNRCSTNGLNWPGEYVANKCTSLLGTESLVVQKISKPVQQGIPRACCSVRN